MRVPSAEMRGTERSGFPKSSARSMSGGRSARAAPGTQSRNTAATPRIEMVIYVPSAKGTKTTARGYTARSPRRNGGPCIAAPGSDENSDLRRILAMSTARAAAVFLAMWSAVPAVAAPKPEQAKVVIAVGGRSLFYYLPLTLADRLGYFKDEGLNVEIADFPGGAKALQAMMGGSADVVSGAYEHVVNMHAKSIDVQEFVLQGRYSGIVLGLSKEKAQAYKSPKDLRG